MWVKSLIGLCFLGLFPVLHRDLDSLYVLLSGTLIIVIWNIPKIIAIGFKNAVVFDGSIE